MNLRSKYNKQIRSYKGEMEVAQIGSAEATCVTSAQTRLFVDESYGRPRGKLLM